MLFCKPNAQPLNQLDNTQYGFKYSPSTLSNMRNENTIFVGAEDIF